MQTQCCNTMKIVCLLALFWIHTFQGATVPPCCNPKTFGEVDILVVGEDVWEDYSTVCLSDCVYEKKNDVDSGDKYCFGAGNLPVECGDKTEPASATNNMETSAASAMIGPENSGSGDSLVCGEDLKTLHGLLNASSYTFDAHCCNNGISTNNITCGNGTDCSSVCDVQATCAKVVLDPEEGEDHCNPRDSRNLNQYGMTLRCINWDSFHHSRASHTTCNIMVWGIETYPPYPEFCFDNTYYGIDFNHTCKDSTKCDVCNCCSPDGQLQVAYENNQLGMTSLFSSLDLQPSNPPQTSPFKIEWKRGMTPIKKCVGPGTNITFNWISANFKHNVVRLTPKAFLLCDFTGEDTKNRSGPFNLKPSPAVTFSYFFASGVEDDCKNGMKAVITISNDCAWSSILDCHKGLALTADSSKAGSGLSTKTFKGTDNQLWMMDSEGRVVNNQSGLVIDGSGGKPYLQPQTPLTSSKQWKIKTDIRSSQETNPTDPTVPKLIEDERQFCLNTANRFWLEGSPVIMWDAATVYPYNACFFLPYNEK